MVNQQSYVVNQQSYVVNQQSFVVNQQSYVVINNPEKTTGFDRFLMWVPGKLNILRRVAVYVVINR